MFIFTPSPHQCPLDLRSKNWYVSLWEGGLEDRTIKSFVQVCTKSQYTNNYILSSIVYQYTGLPGMGWHVYISVHNPQIIYYCSTLWYSLDVQIWVHMNTKSIWEEKKMYLVFFSMEMELSTFSEDNPLTGHLVIQMILIFHIFCRFR